MAAGANRLPAAALAAFGLGIVGCPLPFIIRGGLAQFAPIFSLLTLPPFVAGGAFLLWRHLAKSRAPTRRPLLIVILEILSWLAVSGFTALLSGINLLTPVERIEAVGVSLLATSTLFLPIVLLRRPALERRLERLPPVATAGAALLLWGAVGSLTVIHLRTPPSFLGEHPVGESSFLRFRYVRLAQAVEARERH